MYIKFVIGISLYESILRNGDSDYCSEDICILFYHVFFRQAGMDRVGRNLEFKWNL